MAKSLAVYVYIQRRRIRLSMFFFWMGILVFLGGALYCYLHNAQAIAMIMAGVSVWAASIIYHLYDVGSSLLKTLEEAQE